MNARRSNGMLAALILGFGLAACAESVPREALELSPDTLQRRQLQTRVFDTANEELMLSASAGVLQDLGFQLDESETDLGVIVASKRRDAREFGQIAGAILLTLLGGEVQTEEEQLIRASLVTRPIGTQGERLSVRVTLQRTVWYRDGEVSRIEAIDEPDIYREFYAKLSKSVFLQANTL